MQMAPLVKHSEYGVGIDPGWMNLGAAVVKTTDTLFKFEVVKSLTACPGNSHSPTYNTILTVQELMWGIEKPIYDCQSWIAALVPHVSIERYVSYGNVRSTHTEEITEVIGILKAEFWHWGSIEPEMYKAIDWKTKLCQTLVRYTGFDNPSSSLDKKFSIAAAKHITTNNESIIDDHQADAICLAAYPKILAQTKAVRATTAAKL